MSIETDISTALNSGTPRIAAYPVEAPQTAKKPYVVYTRVSTNRNDTIGGPGTLERARIQFNCHGASYGAAKTLGDNLRTRIALVFKNAVHLHESDEYHDGQHWVWIDYSITKQG